MPEKTGAMKNIIIIGMPGAGKSTAGVILAKTLGMHFIDTDIVIQERTGRLLQEIIDTDGTVTFLGIEEKEVLALHCHNTVIATGGSVVFSGRAMEHLKKDGIVLYLKISCEEMVRRLNNMTTRGIILFGNQSLSDMYEKRILLYVTYAEITIDAETGSFEDIINAIIDQLENFPGWRDTWHLT
jgi:shikimate kinase